MADSPQHAGPAGTLPLGAALRTQRSGPLGPISAVGPRFRSWRRSRPFWAGIFLLVAGAELLLIPLPMDSIGLIVHIGVGGISGILIGAVLMVAGLLLWFHPVQRMFYSIVAVLLAIAAIVASNLGGFLIGTILGVLGGSLGFAWTPLPPGAVPRRLWRRRPTTPADAATGLVLPAGGDDAPDPDRADLGADADLEETADDVSPRPPTSVTPADSGWGRLDPSWGAVGSGGGAAGPRRPTARYAEADARASRYSRPAPYDRISPGRNTVIGGNILAILVGLLTFGLINLSPSVSSSPPNAAATPTPGSSPAAIPRPSPSPSPSASTKPSASPSASAHASPAASPSPAPTGSVPQFALATSHSTLTAKSVTMTDFAYDGVVSVRTATGTVQMMQFSASSLDLTGVHLAVSQGGATETTTASSLDFNGNVVLYATQLSGDLLGVPTTLTPGNALATILQLLSKLGLTQSVTQVIPLQMTNVTTQQPFTSANGMTASALQIS